MWNCVWVIHVHLHMVDLGRWTEDGELLGFGGFSGVKLIRKLPPMSGECGLLPVPQSHVCSVL